MNQSNSCNCGTKITDWVDTSVKVLETLLQVLLLALTVILLIYHKATRQRLDRSETNVLTSIADFRDALNK